VHKTSYAMRHQTASKLARSPYSWVVLAILFCLSMGCTSVKDPLRTVSHVDLPRYMGDWHVIASAEHPAAAGSGQN
jgi:lipocalin